MVRTRTPRRRRYRGVAALALALACALVPSLVARAHETRAVGAYELVVGFQEEPTYVNQPNGVWLSVRTVPPSGGGAERPRGEPVEGLERTLRAEVTHGAARRAAPLRAAFNQPGVYLGDFVPTREGDYIFTFTGTINGQRVAERFESGPGRFDSVRSLAALQFPEREPSAAELQPQLAAARGEAAQARTLGYLGVGSGLLGLLAGIAGLLGARSRRSATSRPGAEQAPGR